MSSRRVRSRRRSGRSRTFATIALAFAGGAAFLLVGGVAVGYGLVSSWLYDLPDHEAPGAFDVPQATRIYSADGTLIARLYLENRTVIPKSQIATDLADAVVAVEDERFFMHDGVDVLGIVRALVTNIMTGSVREGGSTITQQYIRNTILLDERADISVERKVREAFLARELENRKSKSQILELYLNTVYFGEGAYGAQAAAQTFFAKDARDLSLAEAALLAGLPQQPGRLSPFEHPERALDRRNHVLERMLVNGYITQEEYTQAVAEPVEPQRAEAPAGGIFHAPYFVAHVKRVLQQEYSSALVFGGGLEVHTTVDLGLQRMAEDAVFGFLSAPTDPDAALVAIDPRDGKIKAMVGGRDFTTNKFNLATQGRRQPGSAFKTFVLVAAIEEGMPPSLLVDSSSPALIPTDPTWTVANSEGRGRGIITLSAAMRASVNTVFARLIWELNDEDDTGAEKVARVANRMGIRSEIPAYPSIALGTQNVTPLEMASAHGTLATSGELFPPAAITRVIDRNGQVVFEYEPQAIRALEPEVAYATTTVLRGVISGGTGRAAAIGRPAAGKTGTSQNNRDAWFVGYTPELVAAVWVGHYQAETPMERVRGRRGFGGTLAAPIWARFMRPAHEGIPVTDFRRERAPRYTYRDTALRVTVPDLIGMRVPQAQEELQPLALTVVANERYHDTAQRGVIFGQSPEPGARIAPGREVTVNISRGPAPQQPAPPAPPAPAAPPIQPPPIPVPSPEPTPTPAP